MSIEPAADAQLHFERGQKFGELSLYNEAIIALTIAINAGFKSLEARGQRAWCYYCLRRWQLALNDYDVLLAAPPNDDARALWHSSECSLRLKDYAAAIAKASVAIALDPMLHGPYAVRGEAYLRREEQDLEGAIRDLDQAINLGLKLPLVYGTRAEAYYAQGNFMQALGNLRSFNEIQPLGTFEHRLASQCYLDLGIESKASYHARQSVRTSDKSMPDYALALRIRGQVRSWQGYGEAGLKDLVRSLHLLRKFGAGACMIACGNYHRARGHYELTQYTRAIECINKAMKLVPPNAEFLSLRADCYSATGKYRTALADLIEALVLEPGNPNLLVARGECYLRLKSRSTAFTDLNEAIRLNPKLAVAYITRAETYISLEGWELALEDLQVYLQLQDDDGTPTRALAEGYAMIAHCQTELGNDEEANLAMASAQANGWEDENENENENEDENEDEDEDEDSDDDDYEEDDDE